MGIFNEQERLIKQTSIAPLYKAFTSYKPDERTFGYRWCSDENNTVYILKIKINGNYCNDLDNGEIVAFFTEDCTIKRIMKLPGMVMVDSIPGKTKAYYHSEATGKVNEQIKGTQTYFCLSLDDLIKTQGLAINRAAKKEIVPYSPVKLAEWIRELENEMMEMEEE